MVSPSGHQVPTLSAAPAQVKAEITEIVTFLRNPRKFLSMGARSPAGILLVGPPGASWPSLLALSQRHPQSLLAAPQAPLAVRLRAAAHLSQLPAALVLLTSSSALHMLPSHF